MEHATPYPSRYQLLVPAYLCALAWALLAVWLALFAVSALLRASDQPTPSDYFLMGIFAAFFIVAVSYLVAALFARCTNCNRHIFVEGFRQKHPAFQRYKGLNYFSTTVIKVLRDKPFQCMYCGSTYRVPGHAT
jgi:H+/Cl- antiporter ClcA